MAQPDLDAIFLALADPTRRAVIGRLGRGPATVSDLARPFDIGLPSFMKHIRRLEGSGMIRTTKTGRTRTCAMVSSGLAHAASWLAEQHTIWNERADRLEAFVLEEQARDKADNEA
jgi:DNA-binding transcriptional ArsR family regulator